MSLTRRRMNILSRRFGRELSAALACAVLFVVLAVLAPAFFAPANLRDIALNNAAVLIVSVGMTLVILIGQIDISVASQFAVCSMIAGWLAKAGAPMPLLPVLLLMVGSSMGALNGVLIGVLGLPSIIVTLAMLVVWRDGLRWLTEGAWVQDLPPDFQWFGLNADVARWPIVGVAVGILAVFGWMLRHLQIGRALYAVGSDGEAARLAGIDPRRTTVGVFVTMGALVGLASLLNAVRFNSIPSNAGVGLELKSIAAVVVGGAAITGGRANIVGTLLGVVLLGTIGTALTFLGINPFWEQAIQGAIILGALVSDSAIDHLGDLTSRVGPLARASAAPR
jgi:ribose/xylose/arabinose/galactoside ABC-type transport system permease subunit